MSRGLVILGSGNLGRVTAETARDCGVAVVGFLCGLKPAGEEVVGAPVLGPYALLDDPAFLSAHQFIAAVADNALRRQFADKVRERRGTLATLIHPSCKVSPTASIGEGSALHGYNSVRTGSVIGANVVLDDHAHVGNDIVIGDDCYLAPGCKFNSHSSVAAGSFVGAGAVIIPDIGIGEHCLVGAGAVVTKAVPAHSVVAGNPARILRENR